MSMISCLFGVVLVQGKARQGKARQGKEGQGRWCWKMHQPTWTTSHKVPETMYQKYWGGLQPQQ